MGGRGGRCGAAGGRTDSSAARSGRSIFVTYSTVVQRHVVDNVVRRVRSTNRRPTDRLGDVSVVRYDVLQFGYAFTVSTNLQFWRDE